MKHEQPSESRNWLRSRGNILLLLVLGIVGFLLFTDHRSHVFGILPYLLLLACPFMHMFMHRGHGKHSNGRGGHH
jgi:hypothetical protein